MTKLISAVASSCSLKTGAIVVHNYGEFTHGMIVDRTVMPAEMVSALNAKYNRDVFELLPNDHYVVFFPLMFCPKTKRYEDETVEQYRILSADAGFFMSKCKDFMAVVEKQAQYRKNGAALEAAMQAK